MSSVCWKWILPGQELPVKHRSVPKDTSVSVTQGTYIGKYLFWTRGARGGVGKVCVRTRRGKEHQEPGVTSTIGEEIGGTQGS